MNFAFVGHCGSIQTEQSSNTSLMVREGAHTILIDVSGSPVQAMRKLDVDPVQLDAVILTHSHIDHIYALPSLLHNLWLMKRSRRLAIIANKETLQCAASLCSVFSLEAKNAFFGIDWTEATDMEVSQTYGLSVDPDAYIWQLSVGEQQRVELVKTLCLGARFLILDEPTSALTPQETDELIALLKKMTSDLSIIFISHKLQEVTDLSDKITILRHETHTPSPACSHLYPAFGVRWKGHQRKTKFPLIRHGMCRHASQRDTSVGI